MDKEARIAFLNDCDFAILAIHCDYTGMGLVIEDGKITDYVDKEENV